MSLNGFIFIDPFFSLGYFYISEVCITPVCVNSFWLVSYSFLRSGHWIKGHGSDCGESICVGCSSEGVMMLYLPSHGQSARPYSPAGPPSPSVSMSALGWCLINHFAFLVWYLPLNLHDGLEHFIFGQSSFSSSCLSFPTRPFPHVGPRDWTRVVRLGGRPLAP